MKDHEDEKSAITKHEKIMAALFYGVTSLLVIFTNKAVMTQYKFPFFDFLALFQFVVTVCILKSLSLLKKVDIPQLDWGIFKEILPISFMFLGNVICGLGGTRSLNLPMFTALRRFSIFMTMVAEYYILSNKPSFPVVISILMMVGGAMVAAVFDLTFDATGYTLVFLNNCFTALNGVWMRRAALSGKCSKIGVMYYNSLFSAVAMILYFSAEHYAVISNDNYVGSPTAGDSFLDLLLFPEPVSTSNRNIEVANEVVANERRVLLFPSNSQYSNVGYPDAKWSDSFSYFDLGIVSRIDSTDIEFFSYQPLTSRRRSLSDANVSVEFAAEADILISSAVQRSTLASPVGSNGIETSSNLRASNAAAVQTGSGTPNAGKPIHQVTNRAEEQLSSGSSHRHHMSTLQGAFTHPGWQDTGFFATFAMAAMMGSVLNYSIFLCTTKNSALTTAVVGCLKNVATTYIGMILFPDYTFTMLNFVGLNISIAGSLYYTYVTMFKGMSGFGGG